MLKAIIKKGAYYDSVTLMLATGELRQQPGIEDASIVMATPENLSILRNAEMLPSDLQEAGGNDMLVVVKAATEADAENAIKAVDKLFADMQKKTGDVSQHPVKSLGTAMQQMPGANLALISVAGKYASAEAYKAISSGLHVMMFSDNVSTADELALKKLAHEKGLLMMGPDCGTAIINGVPLGFANAVERGNIGLVGASGTGLQEVSSIISMRGGGISQAIGTGGRDLQQAIGGIMFIDALNALATDENTDVICLVSKPPHPEVLKKVLQAMEGVNKPLVVLFIGADGSLAPGSKHLFATTLEEAALLAIALANQKDTATVAKELVQRNKDIRTQAAALAKSMQGKYLRGLFSGGTLCVEAQLVLKNSGLNAYSNVSLDKEYLLDDGRKSRQHSLIDMGTDEFTAGRPHPMIDFGLRNKRIAVEAADQETAIVLLDVVLGYGAHLSPGQELIPVITKAKKERPELLFVCSITGTDKDPQNSADLAKVLERAGVVVMPTMAAAAGLCAEILKQR